MAFFEKDSLKVLSEGDATDLSSARINLELSAIEYDAANKFFYVTVDKILFSNPLATISTVLEAHGYVANLENILSCLDSFVFSIRARLVEGGRVDKVPDDERTHKVSDYLPCVRFELPEQHNVGPILQSFYNEIAKYQSGKGGSQVLQKNVDTDLKSAKSLSKEVDRLSAENAQLKQQLQSLNDQLLAEKKIASQASRARADQESLPANTKICRVEHVDLKRRIVKVKSLRKIIDIPTHMLDRVPEFKARCLITFDDDEKNPVGVLFFDNEELGSLEKRTADLLYVEGNTFKARDSMRNEFQIQALNPMEQATIKTLSRGMKILVSIVDGYVVRFSVLAAVDADVYTREIQEQLVVYDIGKNPLIIVEENALDLEKDAKENLTTKDKQK